MNAAKVHLAYKITNLVTGEGYIGITNETVRRRWNRHVRSAVKGCVATKLGRAIRKYGAEAFAVEAIASTRSRPDALIIEMLLIEQHQTFHAVGGYNLTLGGDGFSTPPDDAQRKQVSEKLTGIKRSKETIARMSAAARKRWENADYRNRVCKTLSNVNQGKRASDETRMRQSEGLRAAYHNDPTFAERVAAASRGKKRSAETCAKISSAIKAAYRRDPTYAQRVTSAKRGKPITDAHREALRVGHKRPWADAAYRERMLPKVLANIAKARLSKGVLGAV